MTRTQTLALAWGLLATTALAQAPRSSEAEALALLDQAQTYVKRHGLDAAYREFNRLDSPYNSLSPLNPKGDLYLYTLDERGYQAVHGKNPKIRGKVMLDMRDADGVYLIRLLRDACMSPAGQGRVPYKWPHPVTHELAAKVGLIQRIPGTQVCLGTGVYP